MTTGRDLKSDGLKLFLIYLVVLGHLSYSDFGLQLNKIIYSFHMPAFVFLSGYFTSKDTPAEKCRKQLIKLLIIYVIAQTLHILLSPLVGEQVTWSNSLVLPHLALWYLLSLIVWKLFAWGFAKCKRFPLLIVSGVLAIAAGFIPLGNEFAFQRTFAFLPFFVAGFIVKRDQLLPHFEQRSTAFLLICFIAGLLIARLLPWFYMPKVPYENWHQPVIRCIQTCLGMALCLSLFGLSRKVNPPKWSRAGQYTLWVYIGHTYLIRLGQHFFPQYGISLNVFTAALLAALYCIFFLLLSLQHELLRFPRRHRP